MAGRRARATGAKKDGRLMHLKTEREGRIVRRQKSSAFYYTSQRGYHYPFESVQRFTPPKILLRGCFFAFSVLGYRCNRSCLKDAKAKQLKNCDAKLKGLWNSIRCFLAASYRMSFVRDFCFTQILVPSDRAEEVGDSGLERTRIRCPTFIYCVIGRLVLCYSSTVGFEA